MLMKAFTAAMFLAVAATMGAEFLPLLSRSTRKCFRFYERIVRAAIGPARLRRCRP